MFSKVLWVFLGWRKKYSLKKIAFSDGLSVFKECIFCVRAFHRITFLSLINVFKATAIAFANGTGTPFPIILNFFDKGDFAGKTYSSGTP